MPAQISALDHVEPIAVSPMWQARPVALFRKKKRDARAQDWGWDPASANLSGEQLWALLANAIYFRSVAPRLDTLGGGLEDLNWIEGLATWWDVRNEVEFQELVEWMKTEGHRAAWANAGTDGGDDKFAWDYCRLITVSGGAALARMVSSDQAWTLVLDAADELANRFDSWTSLADNYLSGRILWLTDKGQWEPDPDPSQAQFEAVASDLFLDDDSPWNRMAWNRDQGVIIDNATFT